MARMARGISRPNRAASSSSRGGNGSGRGSAGRGRGRGSAGRGRSAAVPSVPVPARQIVTGGSPNISTMTSPLAGTTASSMASSSPSTAATSQRVFLDPEEEEFIYDCSQFELNAGGEDSGDEDELLIDQVVEEEALEHMDESRAAIIGPGDYVESSADLDPTDMSAQVLQGAPPGWKPTSSPSYFQSQ
jgi:hypothetical protein